jgi:3-oxoacyl-[acyl-carrier-protein] synthase III
MQIRSILAGVGGYLPDRVMTNAEFADRVETSDEWIRERTGIRQRHFAGEHETCAYMGTEASRAALRDAGAGPEDVDAIILATATPDQAFPSTALHVQAALGVTRGFGFDVSAACAGFIYALSVADAMIRAGQAKGVLVIGSEVYSRILNWQDRTTCVLFGDGAGAAVLKRSKQHRGILSTFVRSDGTLGDLLCRPSGGSARPFSSEVLADRSQFIRMNGRETFKNAVRSMSDAATRALDAAKLTGADIDLMIPHQANVRIIEATAKHANIPMSKVYVNVDRYGNTSAASVPIALDEAISRGVVGEGATVLLVAFGAGFTWGSIVVRL